MLADGNIGGSLDGTGGADVASVVAQVRRSESLGYDGVWTAEVNRDPFFPLLLAAEHSTSLQLGTSIAVAFARNPMTVATTANDLQVFSRGRFLLGLGSQIKPHVERRFSMPWSEPAARMREFIEALHAIWDAWADGTKLAFDGRFYRHTLMTPMFTPPPHAFGAPPVLLAAVGPGMTQVAAEVADGLIVHGFTTARYLREVTLPIVGAGLSASARTRDAFTVSYPGLLATAADGAGMATAVTAVRRQIAFYGSTPAYRAVLELHGWDDLHVELNRLSKAGGWDTMTELIDDDVLHTFAVVGEPDRVAAEVRRRYGDLVDRYTVYAPYAMDDDVRRTVVTGLHASAA